MRILFSKKYVAKIKTDSKILQRLHVLSGNKKFSNKHFKNYSNENLANNTEWNFSAFIYKSCCGIMKINVFQYFDQMKKICALWPSTSLQG